MLRYLYPPAYHAALLRILVHPIPMVLYPTPRQRIAYAVRRALYGF